MDHKTVLAFMAHPDDAEICMGGTLARFADNGYDVHIGLTSVPDDFDTRVDEARKGAAILGATLHVMEFPGTGSTWQVEDVPVYRLVAGFDQLQQEVRPDAIFTHWNGDTHYDHVMVARASLSVARRLQVDLYMCEQPNQYAPWAFPMELNTFIDVSNYMNKRLESIRAHRSQTANRTYEQHVLARARYHGERIGCEYAEGFQCVIQRLTIGTYR
jgi:LmbE family N-acetylglucosaminyl deacetylase